MEPFTVVAGAGVLRSEAPGIVRLPHRWTPGGVSVQVDFTGAHLLHLAVAGCVLNDVYREAARLGVALHGVRVVATGAFDPGTWRSTGIRYTVDVEGPASSEDVAAVLEAVDAVAEIPRALRAGTTVDRSPARAAGAVADQA